MSGDSGAKNSGTMAAAIMDQIRELQEAHEREIRELKVAHAEEVKTLKHEIAVLKRPAGLDTSTIFQDKDAFIRFIKGCTAGTDTPEYEQLYHFLLKCFTDADNNFDGRVGFKEFEVLIETAAFMPRRFGFAPSTAELYPTVWDQTASRIALFNSLERKQAEMAGDNGEVTSYEYISFHSWLNYAVKHIQEKAKLLNAVDPRSRVKRDTREDFIQFIQAAASSRSCAEYKELYHFVLKCFTEVDTDFDGRIDSDSFCRLIDNAASAPIAFGFIPEREEDVADLRALFADPYPTEAEKKEARLKEFQSIDKKHCGYIDFDSLLHYIFDGICEKAQRFGVSGTVPKIAGVCPLATGDGHAAGGYGSPATCPFKVLTR